MSDSSPLHIRYADEEKTLHLCFERAATHRVSTAAEHLVCDFLGHGPPEPQVVLNLAECEFLDSTFAGWMIKLRQRLNQAGGRVVVSRCPEGCRSSLATLGLVSLFEFDDVAPPPRLGSVTCQDPDEVDAETIEMMLHAHEDLSHVSPENERTFSPVTNTLREELKKRR